MLLKRAATAVALVVGLFVSGAPDASALAPSSDDLRALQLDRDKNFQDLSAAVKAYSFEYLTISVPAGTLAGINYEVPVTHIRFGSTLFFGFDRSDLEANGEGVVRDLART